MRFTRFVRVMLILLVASGHLAAAPGATHPDEGSPAATYYCCCPGDCHCTADCCNHGPARSSDPRPPIMREGAGVPAWQSHQRCGAASATLQRSPSQFKILLATDRGRTVATPGVRRLRANPVDAIPSSIAPLSQSSPRAPPAA